MTIKITPIGSCRIHNPLKKFLAQSPLQLNTMDVYGFTHTSGEALQQLKYLQGDYLPSTSIHPILSSRLRFNKTKPNQKTQPSDLYFVEISSAKTVMVDDEFVQMNYIYVYFSEFFLEPNRSKQFWSLASHSNRQELLSFLNQTSVFNAYPAEKKELLSRISVKQMTEDELRLDMEEIVKRVKQVVFVTHCNVSLPDMRAIQSRKNWIKTIECIGKEHGYKIYNPTHLMMGLGQSLCLQKNGLDSTHYTPHFEQKIFNDLRRLYLEPLCQKAMPKEASACDNKSSLDEQNRLEQLYRQGEVSVVLQQLNNLLRKNPHNPVATELLGRILFHIHDYERAIYYFTKLDENQELSNEGRLTLVKSHFNLNQFKEVLNHADLLFEEEVYEPEVIRLSAMASQALGNSDKASIYWEQLYKFENFKLEASSHLALLFEQNNEFKQAIYWINRALELDPMDLSLRAALNKMLATVADEPSLELLLEKMNPISEDELIAIARTAENHGFILTAAKSLNKALVLWPTHSKLKKVIANTAIQWLTAMHAETAEKSEQWLKYLKGILLIQPRQSIAIRLRREYIVDNRTKLKAAYQLMDYDKAISVGMTVYFLDPDFPGIALLIGRCLFAKNLFPEALEWFIKATALNPIDKNAWTLRLRAALKANQYIEALSTIQQSPSPLLFTQEQTSHRQSIVSGVIKGALNEMKRLMEQEELDQAWQLNDLLFEVSPQDKKVLKARQLILKKMVEQLKDAESPEVQIKMAKSIYEKDPNNVQALRILAVSLMKQKKLEESLTYWEKLCILFPEIHSYKMQAQKCMDLEESQAVH